MLGLSAGILLAGPQGRAQFQEPRVLHETLPGAVAPDWDMGLDFAGNILVAVASGDTLDVHTIVGTSVQTASLTRDGGATAGPSLASTSVTSLSSTVAFSGRDAARPLAGNEIYTTTKFGGVLSGAENLSRNDVDDRRPRVVLGRDRQPVVAWSRRQGQGWDLVIQHGDDEPILVDGGDEARLAIDRRDVIHLAYIDRSDTLVYRTVEEIGRAPRLGPPLFETPALERGRTDHELRACDGQAVVAYRDAESYYLVRMTPQGPGIPIPVIGGEFENPFFFCNSGGIAALTWERNGNVWYRFGSIDLLVDELVAVASPAEESRPRIVVDSNLNLYVTFEREGKLFFTTNASAPEASFDAEPTEGEVPLEVKFRDLSSGNIRSWMWDFGDGTTSRLQDPVHVYEEPGLYTVKLVVEGPGGVASLVGEKEIRVLDPSNVMTLQGRRVFPGQKEIYVPLIIRNGKPIQGLQTALRFDPDILEFVRLDFDEQTNLARVLPELIIVNVAPGAPGEGTVVTTGLIIDFEAPHDGRSFEAGNQQRIANFIFNVHASAPMGSKTDIVLDNQLGDPPTNNIFIVDGGQSLLPRLESAVLEVVELTFPLPSFFLRGDADSNRSVNITDTIRILNFLFRGGPPPGCMDAADVDDSGSVNVTDVIFIINYIFLAGAYPFPPFPDFGLDPTPDRFPDC